MQKKGSVLATIPKKYVIEKSREKLKRNANEIVVELKSKFLLLVSDSGVSN